MASRSIKSKFSKSVALRGSWPLNGLTIPYEGLDPVEAICNGKLMARAWADSLKVDQREEKRLTFVYRVIESYWDAVHKASQFKRDVPPFFAKTKIVKMDSSLLAVAKAIGSSAAKLEVLEASYHLGNLYTAVLPEKTRASQGIFYTPPNLTKRLIELIDKAGFKWIDSKIVDPACGGGAFLAPVAMKISEKLHSQNPEAILRHIETHVHGFEIDSFGAWLSQVFVEVSLKQVIDAAEQRLGPLVTVCDTLIHRIDEKFDLVIGNPPYGRVSLDKDMRLKFAKGLYGHANLYGLFTQLAIGIVSREGFIAYVTPTSFLSGEYFKNLRCLIREETTPITADFVTFRKGVFDGVLQETMLALYKKKASRFHKIAVSQLITSGNNNYAVKSAGTFRLASDTSLPWILPRLPEQAKAVKALCRLSSNLKEWGYRVSTGPLVWNRHKSQLSDKLQQDSFPIVWSESVSQDGYFKLKAEKRNHKAFIKLRGNDEWLLIKNECILLQRTTAKEQGKRLIAALLSSELIRKYGGLVVENHVNIIAPDNGNAPRVPLTVLVRFLNSKALNECFRTISGSVAVSAFELESLPLPSPERLDRLQELLESNASSHTFEDACYKLIGI